MKTIGVMYRPIAEILHDLNQPVPPAIISKKPIFRKGKKDGEVDYIHWYDLVDVLNNFAPGWSWEIRTQFLPDRCVIEGRLTIRAAEGEFFMESTGVEPLESNGYGDPVYSAESSALRRAMAKFGYALDLWRKDRGRKQEVHHNPVPLYQPITRPEQLQEKTITQKQINLLWAIAKKEAVLVDTDVKLIIRKFGCESTQEIKQKDFDLVLEAIKEAGKYINYEQRQELVSFCKKHSISNEKVTSILSGCGYEHSSQILRSDLEGVKKIILESTLT